LTLAARQNAYNLRICGAMAPTASPKPPDLDMLVEMAQSQTFFDLLGFGQDLESLLGCKLEVFPDDVVSICLRERINAESLHIF
jgi:predicted nucleotidyltransferase